MEIEPEPFRVEENKDTYLFTINGKKYSIKMDEYLDNFPNFYQIVFELKEYGDSYKMAKLMVDKKNSLPKLCDIKLDFLSKLEFYLISMQRFAEEYERQKGKKKLTFEDMEKDQCSICLGDLYEKIELLNLAAVFDNLYNKNIDVIKLPNCEGHYFHFECMEPYCKNKEHIKCPVCSFIYGTMMGMISFYLYLSKVKKDIFSNSYIYFFFFLCHFRFFYVSVGGSIHLLFVIFIFQKKLSHFFL